MGGLYKVEAETLAEAKEKVLNCEPPFDQLPKGAEYQDDSMMIAEDALQQFNPEEFPEENDWLS